MKIAVLSECFLSEDNITPLNDQSKDIINRLSIRKIKKGAIILNTARGKCIVSEDLADALSKGYLAGAGLDDLDNWSKDNPLLSSPNTVVTPTQRGLHNRL